MKKKSTKKRILGVKNFHVNSLIHLKLLELGDKKDVTDLFEKNKSFLEKCLNCKHEKECLDKFSRCLEKGNMVDHSFAKFFVLYQGRGRGLITVESMEKDRHLAKTRFWLDEFYQGKGIMLQSIDVLIKHYFEELRYEGIIMECTAGNIRARKIPVRLGFEEVAERKKAVVINGETHDLKIYRLKNNI